MFSISHYRSSVYTRKPHHISPTIASCVTLSLFLTRQNMRHRRVYCRVLAAMIDQAVKTLYERHLFARLTYFTVMLSY